MNKIHTSIRQPINVGNLQGKITFINAHTKIKGSIVSHSKIHVSGMVEGDLTAKTVHIDEKATCVGTITSDLSIISGQFDGEVITKHIQVKSTAQLHGKIKQKTIEVDEGAKIDAMIQGLGN